MLRTYVPRREKDIPENCYVTRFERAIAPSGATYEEGRHWRAKRGRNFTYQSAGKQSREARPKILRSWHTREILGVFKGKNDDFVKNQLSEISNLEK